MGCRFRIWCLFGSLIQLGTVSEITVINIVIIVNMVDIAFRNKSGRNYYKGESPLAKSGLIAVSVKDKINLAR